MANQIPEPPTSFVGRERELGELARLLRSSRQVTLTGPAGSGKTRLALRLAHVLGERYADGVYWVALAPLADPALLAQTVAGRVGIRERAERPPLAGIVDALAGKDLLLLLDNCEHLLPACTRLVSALLADTTVTVLATSRQPLGVPGERLYPVPPLSLPPPGRPPDRLDGSQFDALRLFAERARAIVPSFALTPANAAAVADICRRLDGNPLALEMAAARVNVLTVAQIAARLGDRFALLAPAGHVTYSPHRSLRAAIDWSYDLLAPAEQILLRRLSVFAGGFSLAAAETICSDDGSKRVQVLDLLSSLVNKSLVTSVTLRRAEARYFLLAIIRHYGAEKAVEAGEQARLRDRHLDYYLELTEEAAARLNGRRQEAWLNRLEEELDNIRAALSQSLAADRIEAGLRVAIALYQFWTIRDYAEEALTWLERLLGRAGEGLEAAVRANALCYALLLANFRGNRAAREKFGREVETMARTLGPDEKRARFWMLAARGFIARLDGDHQTAFALAERQIQLLRDLDDPYELGMSLTINSFMAMSLQKFDRAREMLAEGLPLLRRVGNPYRIAMALNFSGDLARCEQDFERAQAAYEESIALLREIDAVRDLASALHNLALTRLRLGTVDGVEALLEESLALHRAQENRPGMTECLLGFAALATVADLPTAAARLLAAAAALGGRPITSQWAATSRAYAHYLDRARAALGEAAFRRAQAAGQTMSLEQALAFAESVGQKATAARQTRRRLGQLTPREREVAALIGRAMSNGDIAAELVISKRTVESHVSAIRAKLGFGERAEIVRWAIAAGLVDAADAGRV